MSGGTPANQDEEEEGEEEKEGTPTNQLRSEPEDFGSAVGFTLKSDTLHQNIEMNI